MLIYKYSLFLIKILQDNIYNLIILAILHSIFTFCLNNRIVETIKFKMICYLNGKLLLLFNLKLYGFLDRKLDNMLIILETAEKNLLIISFL